MSGTIFWAAAAVISIAVALIVATPLLRAGQRIGGAARARYDLAVFRDQLKEVERDQETGLLSSTEAIAAKGEIERRMLRAVDGDVDALDVPDEETPPPASAAAFSLALGIVVAGAVIALYLITGQPGLGDAPLSLRTDLQIAERGPAQAAGGTDGSAMQAQLRQRLADNPNDIAGWVTLGRTERVLGNHPEAVRAFERAIELAGRNATADLIADYGEAQVFEAFGTVSPRAIETFENALEKDPGEIKSRFYIAEGRAQSGDYEGAIALWRGLTADAPPEAPWVGEVRARISNAAMKGSIMPMQVPPERPSGKAKPAGGLSGAIAGEAAPTADDIQAVQEMAPQDQTAFIRSMVQRLADKMEEKPGDVDGWLRLGRAYEVLEDQAKSKTAFGQAKRRLQELLANTPKESPNRASLEQTLAEVESLLAQ